MIGFEGRWVPVATTALIASSSALSASSELLPLPEPALAGVEDAVREQLIDRRTGLADLIASGVAEDAKLAQAYGALGQVYFAYEIMDAAEPCLLNARQLEPEEFRWSYLLGALYSRSEEAEKALDNLLSAATLRPDDVPTKLRLGRLYLDLARLDEAEALFSRALKTDDRSAAAHHGLGRVAQERGEWRASLAHLERALELQPGASSIHYLLGIAHRELGEMTAARQHLRLNEHEPVIFSDPEVDRLDALIEGGRYYLQLGDLALGRGNRALAIRAYREAVRRGPRDALAHYNLGLTLANAGSRDEGLAHLQEAVELDPDYRDAHFNLGVVLEEEERVSEAEGHFSRALEIDPDDDEARLAWARSLARVGRGAEGEAVLEKMLAQDPGNPEVSLALAEALDVMGRSEEAESILAAVIDDPRDATLAAQAHDGLSRLALRRGSRSEAIEHLRAAVKIEPRLPGGFERLGTLLGQEGAFREAAVEFGRAAELEPRSFSVRFGQAMALLLSGQSAETKRAVAEAIEFVDEDLPLRHLLARLLATAPEPEVRDGARALTIASEVYRSRPTADHAETVAMALAEEGDFEQAVKWQEQALALAASAPPRQRADMRRRLEMYRRREPSRSPWLDG